MNIILEDNINFYEELKNIDSEDEVEENICLLTFLPLDQNKITLPCNHSFNFIPLYQEILAQKNNLNKCLETNYVSNYQIKCPYCRIIHNFLLPHIKLTDNMIFSNGVNSPEKYSMSFHTCKHILTSGKNKNQECNRTAFYKNKNCLCTMHHRIYDKKQLKENQCCAIIKRGKRAGEECGAKTYDNTTYCKRHLLHND